MTRMDVDKAPLVRALLVLGDMWTLRIVMLVFKTQRRFQDIRSALSISDPVLSRRLNSLVEDGILNTRAYQHKPLRHEYTLTSAGRDMWALMLALWAWDQRWAGRQHRDAHIEVRHSVCGNRCRPVFGCGACNAIGVTINDVTGHLDKDLLREPGARRSRRSPLFTTPIDSSGVLGDRWSTFLLTEALAGTSRFSEFQSNLDISPVTLTERLNLFVESDLMQREDVNGGRRQDYRLTPKALDFFEVIAIINAWAQRWVATDGNSGLSVIHDACDSEFVPQYTCNACNGVIDRREIQFEGQIKEL